MTPLRARMIEDMKLAGLAAPLAEFRRLLATVRELPPALSFAKALAARQSRVA